jgi:hypothetical protein
MEYSWNIQGTFREHWVIRRMCISSTAVTNPMPWQYPVRHETFREHSGNIQGTFREHSGNIQETLSHLRNMHHTAAAPSQTLCLGSTLCVKKHSENVQGTFSEHSGNIQGTLSHLRNMHHTAAPPSQIRCLGSPLVLAIWKVMLYAQGV